MSFTAGGRATIGYEGKIMMPHNVLVPPGAIKMDGARIPITWGFHYMKPPVGWGTDYQVNEAGEISIAVEFTNPDVLLLVEKDDLLDLYTVSMYLSGVEKTGKNPATLTHGNLRSVALVPIRQAGSWA